MKNNNHQKTSRTKTNQIIRTGQRISLNVDVHIIKENEYYVAYCPSMELSSYGDTVDKAKKSFEEELSVFIEETNQRGTLEKYLLQNGWKLQQKPKLNYEPPRPDTEKLYRLIKSKESTLFHKRINIPVT